MQAVLKQDNLAVIMQRFDGLRGVGRRLRVIFFFLACRGTRCAVSGGELEGGVEKVCVLTGGVRRSGCSRPVFQVTRRGMRASTRRKMS